MGLLLFAFIAVFLLVASGGLLLFYREAMIRRLNSILSGQTEDTGFLTQFAAGGPAESIETLVQPFQRVIPRSVEEVSVVQKRLIRAGYRKDAYVNIFYGAKVIVPVSLSALATVTGLYEYGMLFVYAVTLG